MKFRPFAEAKEFVQSLGLKNEHEWREYCRSGKKPADIPAKPRISYKKEWVSMGDWLGTGYIAPQRREFRPFAEAREFVRTLELKSQKQWFEYCKSGRKAEDIPASPHRIYSKEWKGWGDWLGTGRIADQDKVFRPFAEAREFVRTLKLKNQSEWRKYCKSGNKPIDIPANPALVYKKDWKAGEIG